MNQLSAFVQRFWWPDLGRDEGHTELPTLLEMYVTAKGRDEILRYEVAVTTIEELSQRFERETCISGHGQIIVRVFDIALVESFLRRAIAGVSADSWGELEAALGRFGRSEFDMVPGYWVPDPWDR